MPFYEYQCQACGAQVEVLQKITDAPLKKCPECAKSKLVKLISAPVFRLKGSGWYETDFKTDKDAKRNLAGDEAAPAKADEADGAKAKAPVKTDAPAAAAPADKAPAAKAKGSAPKPKAKSKAPVKAKAKAKGRR
jgi:putative FmdB family regulatory protein